MRSHRFSRNVLAMALVAAPACGRDAAAVQAAPASQGDAGAPSASAGTPAAGSAGKPAAPSAGASGRDAPASGRGAGAGAAGAAGRAAAAPPSAGTSGMGASGSGGSSGTGTPAGAGGTTAAPAKKFVGNITTGGQVRPDFAMLWEQITPENEGKWGSVEATRDQMNWAGLDRIRDYAKTNGLVFKQHTFVWGSQQPSWLAGLPAAEQRAEVEEWIQAFCERYPEVELIDVVNEPPPHTTPVYLDALGGAGSSGYDWIVQSFQWARQYCPNAILILNDYNVIEYGGDNQRFLDIVAALQRAGAPLDALGAQAHDAHKLANDVVQGFIDKLTATGLPLYITEYDIDIASDDEQKQVMERQFPIFWNDEQIAGITLWGYVVGSTWRPNTGLMTNDGTPRPALTWLQGFLGR